MLLYSLPTLAGPYVELGLGVPLFPKDGYIPDMYGEFGVGYRHAVDERLSLTIGFEHRSLTREDTECDCSGDNAIEAKLRLEW